MAGEPSLKQYRSRNASLWQSAVDRVVADSTAAASPAAAFGNIPSVAIERPSQDNAMVAIGNDLAAALDCDTLPEIPAPPGPAAGFIETVAFCSKTALRIAEARVKSFFTGDETKLNALLEEVGAQFGGCDPRWATVIAEYVRHRIESLQIPYRVHSRLDDFVISGSRFPDDAKIAILGDWGTGQSSARALLEKVAARDPDVVIHLGDVYYSGTEHEFQNYFYPIWKQVLGLPQVAWGEKLTNTSSRPSTFTLSGNHDMYAGGAPYYTVIDMIGQPASYFCLRNANWQFIALDTGKNDADPTAAGNATHLEDTEVAWLKHQVATADGRKTVLLSHHQLYTAFEKEKIGDSFVNPKLLENTRDILPQVTAWFWGHEHNLVIYKKFQNVLGRCVGHGAFPVGVDELGPLNPSIPIERVQLKLDVKGGLFQHGYAIMQLAADTAETTYFQFDALTGQEEQIYTEVL